MIIKINESNFGFYFMLTPETLEDAASLLRMASMAKRESIRVTTSFNSDINCWFTISKKLASVKTYIDNEKR